MMRFFGDKDIEEQAPKTKNSEGHFSPRIRKRRGAALPTGFQCKVVDEGTDGTRLTTDTVVTHYRDIAIDGKEVFIPPDLAYGKQDAHREIGLNSTPIF